MYIHKCVVVMLTELFTVLIRGFFNDRHTMLHRMCVCMCVFTWRKLIFFNVTNLLLLNIIYVYLNFDTDVVVYLQFFANNV